LATNISVTVSLYANNSTELDRQHNATFSIQASVCHSAASNTNTVCRQNTGDKETGNNKTCRLAPVVNNDKHSSKTSLNMLTVNKR